MTQTLSSKSYAATGIAIAALLFLTGASQALAANYFNGFETDTASWNDFGGGVITRVADGSNGIASADGSFHAEVTGPVYTTWGGYETVFPALGYTTSIDIYLDMDLADGTDKRFDFSSAVNTPANAHLRDFIFHVGTDAANPGEWLVSASNNAPGWPGNPARNPISISESGWYTFQHTFADNAGVLEVTLEVLDDSDTVLGTWVLSTPTDLIGVNVGGNRYGWFTAQQFDFDWLAIDNAEKAAILPVDTDTDDDGVLNDDDLCEAPAVDDNFSDFNKAKGRYEWNGSAWATAGKGDQKFFEMLEAEGLDYTYGCTGRQILDSMSETLEEDFGGHYKHGLSKSILEAWHAGEYYVGKTLIDTVTVDSADFESTDSNVALDDENDYFIKAMGTWTNRGTESVDAEYSNWNGAGWVNGPDFGYPANLLDLQVDETFVEWGVLDETTHTYEIAYAPASDGVINFRIFDHSDINAEPDGSWYGDNVGSLTVEIYEDLYIPLWP